MRKSRPASHRDGGPRSISPASCPQRRLVAASMLSVSTAEGKRPSLTRRRRCGRPTLLYTAPKAHHHLVGPDQTLLIDKACARSYVASHHYARETSLDIPSSRTAR